MVAYTTMDSRYFIPFLSKSFQSKHEQKIQPNFQSLLPIGSSILNLTFFPDSIYHHDGIAYDFYSINDLSISRANDQWRQWPFPSDKHVEVSPFVASKIPFIDAIYIVTDPSLAERHDNVKKALLHQGISVESMQWIMKWNRTTCFACYSQYILGEEDQRRCALAMKHIDVWHDIVERNIQLALILEDDVIFVPFFKEKLIRMIYAAFNSNALQINDRCVKAKWRSISNDEWTHQNPMIVIGTCLNLHGQHFQSHLWNASPILTTHKAHASRCSHAYILTLCSAKSLIEQIQQQKNVFLPIDHMQNYLFRLSPTLQSFWIDPPLVYQGNQVVDLDQLNTFAKRTYK